MGTVYRVSAQAVRPVACEAAAYRRDGRAGEKGELHERDLGDRSPLSGSVFSGFLRLVEADSEGFARIPLTQLTQDG
jgi:hypothetical protein